MQKEERLGKAPVGKLMVSLAIPAVIAQLINVLYNIVDRIYIGHIPEIGDIALTGVGVTFPIVLLIAAFSYFVGMGGAPLASIKLGQQNHKAAEKILSNGFTILLFFSIVLTVIFLMFKQPLLYLFGASNASYPYANQYITIYVLGTVFVQMALGLNSFISAQGFAKTAMLSVLIGAVTNIVLDPIFIFIFQMGVQGAALATIISQALSAIWVIAFLTSSKSQLKIRFCLMKPDKTILKAIAGLGISPFIMQSTESLISLVFNAGLQHYGNDLYVGSMTIMLSIMQLIVIPLNGITQGAQPVISYNYGAKQYKRVRKASKLMVISTFCFATVTCTIAILFPQLFAQMFTQEPELLHLTQKLMPIYLAGVWIFGAQQGCQGVFLALGQAKTSVFIALLRKVILLVPFAFILPVFFGVNGIIFAEPIADIIAACTTLVLFAITYKKLLYPKEEIPQ